MSNTKSNREYVNRLYEAVQNIENIYNDWSKAHGLLYYDMQLYYSLMETPNHTLTQKDIVEQIQAPKTTVNSLVKRHLAKGYISMTINPNNQREKLIQLTPAGKEFAKELILPLFKQEELAVTELSTERIEEALKTLEEFGEIIRKLER